MIFLREQHALLEDCSLPQLLYVFFIQKLHIVMVANSHRMREVLMVRMIKRL